MNRSALRRPTRFLLALLGLAVLIPVVLVEVDHPVRRVVSLPLPAGAGPFAVYVADWGYHTSIILPQPPEWRLGPAGNEHVPFVEYSWGNRNYFMSDHPGLLAGAAALFLPSASTVYVESRSAAPLSARMGASPVAVRLLSATELQRLATELEESFDRATLLPRAAGYAGRFYASSRHFLWWYNCNRWTVDRLNSVGLARSGRGVLFAGQVFGRLRGFASR